MELVTTREDYDSISWSMRMHVARKLVALLEHLDAYVDGSMGDVAPGHVQVYVRTAHELAALFEGQKRPFEPKDQGIPLERVQQMLADQRAAFDAELTAAVADAQAAVEQRIRVELEQRERLSVEQGRDAVLASLRQVAAR